MPTWGELLAELNQLVQNGVNPPYDVVRRKYLTITYNYTGRNTILYATKWTQGDNIPPALISITEEDIQGLMEVIHGLTGSSLDLIIHFVLRGAGVADAPYFEYGEEAYPAL